jgi:ribosomal protein S18 acetylase RimI-like enzyme
MLIRDYRPDDYETVVTLWNSAGLPAKCHGRDTREEIARQIATGCVFVLLAEHVDEVVGTLLGSHDSRRGWINRLAVAPHYQRSPMGVAVRLLEEAEARFRSMGIGLFVCLIEDQNKASWRFFQRMGYLRFDGVSYYTKRLRPGV